MVELDKYLVYLVFIAQFWQKIIISLRGAFIIAFIGKSGQFRARKVP